MKIFLATITVAGVLGVILFGGYAMHLTDSHASGCIASSVLGVLGCPTVGPASLFSHLDALRVFSTAVLGAGFAMAWGAFALVFLFAVPAFPERDIFVKPVRERAVSVPVRLRYFAWLSLHENSPSFMMGAGI